MQNASSFAEMLQQAVERGQVVLIPAPDQPLDPPRPAPLRARSEVSLAALCLTFKLKRTEGQILVWLLTHDCSTPEELRAAAAHANKTITAGTTRMFVSTLREKLAIHGVRITTVPRLGYGIDGTSRSKIYRLLAEFDGDVVAAAAPPTGDVEKTETA